MRTLSEAALDPRKQAISIESDAENVAEVYDAINEEMGEEFLPLDDLADAINNGQVEICSDGVVVWMEPKLHSGY